MLQLEQPNESQLDYIYAELNTNEETIRSDVRSLIQWLEKQPHLPNIKDERFLTNCLLRSKNSLEKTKNSLDAYYTLKSVMPEVYDNRNPDSNNIESSMKAMSFIPLPKLTNDGCRISILRVFDPAMHNKVDPDDVLKTTYMSSDLRSKSDGCRSDILIFDLQNFTMPVISVVMRKLRKFVVLGTKGIPLRQKSYYIVNVPAAAESLITFTKSFLKKDLIKKINILRNKQDLLHYLPKDLLPNDYGGDLPSLPEIRDAWLETLKHHKDWFMEDSKVKADNSKRLTRIDRQFDDLSLEGSFRKIILD